MALVLGLDIGTHSITGAVLAGTPKKFRLVDYFREEIPGLDPFASPAPGAEYTPPPSQEELIQKIIADHNLQAADVVVAMDAKDCIVREIPVQFTKEEQISKVISFTAEEYLPTINLEDVVLEYLKIGEANGKSTVALFALRNDVIEARLALLKRADVDPIALDLDAAALFNAFALTPTYDPKKATLLIDMGATSTKIVLVEDGRLKKVRAFRTAPRISSPDRLIAQPAGVASGAAGAAGAEGEAVFGDYSIESRFKEIEEALRKLEPSQVIATEASLEDFDPSTPIAILSDEDFERVQDLAAVEAAASHAKSAPARERSGEFGGPEGKSSTFDYGEYLGRIGIEVQRTLASSRSNVELICLTGGMSAREDACRFFNETFDVETIQLDVGDSIETDVEPAKMTQVSRYGAVALGLAAKELGRDQTGLDFRKGRFRYEHRFARLKYPLLLAAALLFVFFLQTAYWAYHENRQLVERADAFASHSRDVYKAFFGKQVADGRDPLVASKEQRDKWKGKGVGNVGKVLPYVDAVRNVGEVMNGSQFDFKLRNMSFDFRVKASPASQGKAGVLKGNESSLDIMTSKDDANLLLERKFNKDPKSEFFEAKCSSKSVKDGYQVIVTLTPKASAIAKLE